MRTQFLSQSQTRNTWLRRTKNRTNAAALGLILSFGVPSALATDNNNSEVATKNQQPAAETVTITIHPKTETKPSLKIQLIPEPTQQLEGNAAVFYLKAMGFLEQNPARDRIREIYKQVAERAKAEGKEQSEYPPYSYLEMRPKDYPVAEVREYLDGLLAFQVPMLKEARLFRDFTLHRNLQLSDNPIGYLLPEIQAIRELARTQSIRCRLAIAEGRLEDAIEVIGQQLTMSRHIGKDDFLVSQLVGYAIQGIACEDALFLIEQPNCPNLYWAFTQLPNPLLDADRCLAFERQFAYLQIPKLKDVDTSVRTSNYWIEFIAEFAKRTSEFDAYQESSTVISKVQGDQRAKAILDSIQENVPQATEYLLARGIITKESVDSYPKEQLVLLAMRDFYDVSRDDQFKLLYLPYQLAAEKFAATNAQLKKDGERYGWFTGLAIGMLPNIDAFHTAQARLRQRVAVILAIEAIRMAASENGGRLVDSLDATPVPVPNDPFTGKPFTYQVNGDTAILSSDYPTNRPTRIELKLAK